MSAERRDLFVVSFLILFLELACIRWFPAHVLYLTFFTNTMLLASFLGMSVGCLAARSSRRYFAATPALLAAAMLAGVVIEEKRHGFRRILDVGGQASPQVVFFGAESPGADAVRFMLPIELLAGFFFLLVALAFVGPGQILGRCFDRVPDRVAAYTWNIAGSFVGIVAFTLLSWRELSPVWWFGVVVLILGWLLSRRGVSLAGLAPLVVVLLASAYTTGLWPGAGQLRHLWSPYYRVDYQPEERTIAANLIGHQTMVPRAHPASAYALPYLLRRDSGGEPYRKVLIVGAGSGNDVARALQWGADEIDAVEIDPVIQRLGAEDHPDRPYDDERVDVHIDDGRNFLRSGDDSYDLIVYALVDSLVLHSSYSNLRLESYLFTQEALEDVRRRLRPGGVFAMYNFFRQGWIVGRLQRTLTNVFGRPPVVLTLPHRERVTEEASGGFTLFLAGDTAALEAAFGRRGLYRVRGDRPPGPDTPSGFDVEDGSEIPFTRFGPASVDVPEELEPARDDWPYLYLRRPMIPGLSVRGVAVMSAVAVVLLLLVAPRRRRPGVARTQGVTMFFLGAGFMLIESGAVVQMALLLGSTWMVNALVFLGVLGMILLANLLVWRMRPHRLWPWYLALAGVLLVRYIVPLELLLGLPRGLQLTLAVTQVFSPIFFAGVVFAACFARSAEPDRDFGLNVAGAMTGGFVEYSSMLMGFGGLTLLAMAFYALSAAGIGRGTPQNR